MIIRIVKMEFKEGRIPDFLKIFAASKDRIRSFPGCQHLELLQDEADACIFFTYSHWDGKDVLDTYRNSEVFQSVWGDTKKLFRTTPQAWSLSDQTATESYPQGA